MKRWGMAVVMVGGCGAEAVARVESGDGKSSESATSVAIGGTSVATTGTGEEADDHGGFIGFWDCEGVVESCGPWGTWACSAGYKCAAWANDGGRQLNDLRCVEVVRDPDHLGEACTVQGSDVTGVDSCDALSRCWNVDPQTLEGTCVAHCGGSERSPFCDVDTSCMIANGGVIVLCLPDCDPVVQDCPHGQRCVVGHDTPTCVPTTASFDFESPCQNACAVGEYCADASDVPGCSELGCCTPFCDLTAVSPDTACPGALLGQRCLPLFENPTASVAHVGGCGIP